MYFKTKDEAVEWMESEIDDPCIDNIRFAYKDDEEEMRKYDEQCARGCCGYYDSEVNVNGRFAMVGCNFGH